MIFKINNLKLLTLTYTKSKTMKKIQHAKEKLSKYGDLRSCRIIKEDVVLIFMTKDLSEEPIKIFEILNECQKCFPEHTILNTGINESHHALLVLTKPS